MRAKTWLLMLSACSASAPAGSPEAPSLEAGAPYPDAAGHSDASSPDAGGGPQADAPTGGGVTLPGGSPGIGFDDLRLSARLGRLLVPAGRTGDLDLIDPSSRAVSAIRGFTSAPSYDPASAVGATSADEGRGTAFAADRGNSRVVAVDVTAASVTASAALAAIPDYVRFVPTTGEVWVTEPATQSIEVFTTADAGAPSLARAASIAVAGGPESLVVDPTRGRAYTNTFGGTTIAVDLASRAVVATWPNGCASSRGITLDEARGIVFVGCAEGAVTSLDADTGERLASLKTGAGVDIVDYAPALRHLYVPASADGTMAFVGVPGKQGLELLGTAATVQGAHCVVADGIGQAWVCDPAHGQLLVLTDPYPRSASSDAGLAEGGGPDAGSETAACTRVCSGVCGPDGCGGSCGSCPGAIPCQDGQCATTCTQSCAEKCGWDPYQKGGMGAFACVPQSWATDACNGIGGIGQCDMSGALQRCTSAGLVQDLCGAGCGLHASADCGSLTSCIVCNATPEYCPGVYPGPICQGGLRIECYDNAYLLEWCADTNKTCECTSAGCMCQ